MATSASESLERLQGIYRDLRTLSDTTLQNIERLLFELEAHVVDFRTLLDKKPKNDQSRQRLNKGSVELPEGTFDVNEEFRQDAIQLADALDLDELDAAELYLNGIRNAQSLDRSPLASAVILFHSRRQFLLECLRLALHRAFDPDVDEEALEPFRALLGLILQEHDGRPASGSAYWRRCIKHMADIEAWSHMITERVQSVSITDQIVSSEFTEIMDFQRVSLNKQHESLGAIVNTLIKANHTNVDDLRFLLPILKRLDRYDMVLIHYIPVVASLVSQFASSENMCPLQDARSLNDIITSMTDNDGWALRNFHAAIIILWLSEYAARYVDQLSDPILDDIDLDAEADTRSAQFMDALKEGAFHFILAVGQGLRSDDWYDPARHGFAVWLLQDAPTLQMESFTSENFMREILMERIQAFIDAFITNMPDTLRKLKFEEDEQRRQLQNRLKPRTSEFELHFERFLIIVSYTFQGFPDAAEVFWSDPDGNLFGFLQWASQRQSTARVAAFCEMLRSLSEGEECAESAHKFLLGEATIPSAKLRRNSPLSYNHIFQELEFYSSSIQDRLAIQPSQGLHGNRQSADQTVEPESYMMLEAYLRLLSHLCNNSSTARKWLLTRPTFNFQEHLFLLCSSAIESRLRACAFTMLAALLTHKNEATRDSMWSSLDSWITGSTAASSNLQRPSNTQPSQLISRPQIFAAITTGFEEPNAFVGFLHSLVSPCYAQSPLNDFLPFPENLGSAYRMPGIEPFVDFVFERVFITKSYELQDPVQLRIMRCSCLGFMLSCLASFNEDLVLFANKSIIAVDNAIRTSSLATYVRLHPFARTIEWLFNDRVIDALFAAACQDPVQVSSASVTSPLVVGLMRSIEIINLILTLQSTYFDIVRPIVKLQSTNRRQVVANPALASFEDAVMIKLDLVRLLGLYCGSGHEALTVASLRLLQQLSASRKLAAPNSTGNNRQVERSRLVTALERNDGTESISRSLVSLFSFDERDLEADVQSQGFIIRSNILIFLNSCLASVQDRPTISQLLLGFSCGSHSLDVPADGLFANGTSLFHAIVDFLIDCPPGIPPLLVSTLVKVRDEAYQVLRKLWRSPLSTHLTLAELRFNDFFFIQSMRQVIVLPDALWDGRTFQEVDFLLTESAIAFTSFLSQRGAFLEYAAAELRSVHKDKLTSLQSRIQETLLGSTTLQDGQQVQNPTVLDYLDFLELDFGLDLAMPESIYFEPRSFDVCKINGDSLLCPYDLQSVTQILLLRRGELRNQGKLNELEDMQVEADASNIWKSLMAFNAQLEIRNAHNNTLASWAQLVTVMLSCCDFETVDKQSMIISLLQAILPRLEKAYTENMQTAIILADLGKSLIRHVEITESLVEIDTSTDKVYQLFQAALIGVQSVTAEAQLRETCCWICHTYLRGICSRPQQKTARRHALQSFKMVGERLTETLCDDAYAGQGECRTSSLLFLDGIVTVSNLEHSRDMIESFNRLNFVEVMVNNISSIPGELQVAESAVVASILSYHDASLTLLLRISQTRSGATHVLNAGIFRSIRASGIFAADPDIGLDIDNPDALSKYFQLMLSIVRVLNAIVLSRGTQNEQTTRQMWQFVHEYRPCIVAIFKRGAKIGSADGRNEQVLGELVDNFTVLIAATGFLNNEEDKDANIEAGRVYS